MLNIFEHKNNNINIINKKGTLLKEIKHYPTSTKEWYNSVYFFQKSNQKDIPSLDISVLKTIRNYFNMYSSILERKLKIHKKPLWKRKLMSNRVLIGKPEFKHTNDKVIITLYIYNRELSSLKFKLNNVRQIIYAQLFFKLFTTKYLNINRIRIIKNLAENIIILKNKIKNLHSKRKRLFKNLNKKYRKNKFLEFYGRYIVSMNRLFKDLKSKLLFINDKNLISIGKSIYNFKKLLNGDKYLSDSLNIREYSNNFSKIITNNSSKYLFKYLKNSISNLPKVELKQIIYLNVLNIYIDRIKYYLRIKRLLKFNQYKFNVFISPVIKYLEKIYKKNVEFNIVTLKNYYLDSNLFTQVMALKLKNKRNKLSNLINKVLLHINIPITRRHQYFSKLYRTKQLQNLILKHYLGLNFISRKPVLNINSIVNKKKDILVNKLNLIKLNNDKLDLLLKSIYYSEKSTMNLKKVNNTYIVKRNIENTVLDTVLNKSIIGTRIESSGRLTKRITAARSIFNIKQKGTIRNINSSYKKIPSVLLRGNLRANLQYTATNNTTRIGAFGLKGWINSI